MSEKNIFNDIDNPKHYHEGRKYEPYKVIHDWDLNFNLGSAVKYISRAGRKYGNDKKKDLEKAIQYLKFELEADELNAKESIYRSNDSVILYPHLHSEDEDNEDKKPPCFVPCDKPISYGPSYFGKTPDLSCCRNKTFLD